MLMHGAKEPLGVTSGLVLYLDAANARSYPKSGTTWFDRSGLGNNGTLTNGPTYNSSNYGSLSFDGIDDYVDCGPYRFNTAQGTISFWFQPTTDITTSANKRAWGMDDFFEARWNLDGGKLCFDLGGDQNLKTTITSWISTIWYNIVCTWDTSTLTSTAYVQGIIDATGNTGSTATIISSTGNFRINCRSGSTQFLDAKIPIFMMYNRALTLTEIQQNYDAFKGRYGLT